jgi:hypothetical protein
VRHSPYGDFNDYSFPIYSGTRHRDAYPTMNQEIAAGDTQGNSTPRPDRDRNMQLSLCAQFGTTTAAWPAL